MEPKFIVVGENWINVNAIAWIQVRKDSRTMTVGIHFLGSSQGSTSGFSLSDQQANEFMSKLAELQTPALRGSHDDV